jgi:hypothetical protein
MTPMYSLFLLSLLSGAVGLLWGLSELIGAFQNETPRALRTVGGWLLLALNFLAAAAIFLLIASLIPEANNWLAALLIGLAWPTVVRNASFKLAEPLQPDKTREAAAVRFEEAYKTFQTLARQMINHALTRERMLLLERAIQFDMDDLERQARKLVIVQPLQVESGASAEDFISEIVQKDVERSIKKAYLVAFILSNFGRTTLSDFIEHTTKSKGNSLAKSPEQKP